MAALILPTGVEGQRLGDLIQRAPTWSSVWYNTTRAFSENEGPVWAGRGLTIAATSGVTGHWGPLSYSLRPIAFWAENRGFEPSPSRTDTTSFDGPFPGIDTPYRFGRESYARLDAGESYVRADALWFAAGVSNAAQYWGPGRINQLMLGANAGGFPHVFLESNRLPIGIGYLSGRWMAGSLVGSGFEPGHDSSTGRALIGAVASFEPRGMRGLSVGGSRLFHLRRSSVSYDLESLLLPFGGLVKTHTKPDTGAVRGSNQLGSLFARVAPPGSGLEVYGEYVRDDHAYDIEDVAVEPDHESGYLIGFAHERTGVQPGDFGRLTIEAVNGRFSHVARVRDQAILYAHTRIIEGHTERGLLLGSPDLPGGGGLIIRYERSTAATTWRFLAERINAVQDREGGTWQSEMTGTYTLGVTRGTRRGAIWWTYELLLQPTFGGITGTNLRLRIRAGDRSEFVSTESACWCR